MYFLRIFVVVLVAAIALSGCTLARVSSAWAQSKAAFFHCTSDSRIMCEPGSEKLAEQIAPLLPQAIEVIEKAQFTKFSSPIVIYTYSTDESFAAHTPSPGAVGVVFLGTLNMSPKLLQQPERIQRILTHELSHLNFNLQIGSLAWSSVPTWFQEGLAVYVSKGGGAEFVSETKALIALRQGQRFEPNDSQWGLFPRGVMSYGLDNQMFYRQSELFVRFLHDRDPGSFEAMLKAIAAKTSFVESLESSYHQSLPALWGGFISSLQTNNSIQRDRQQASPPDLKR